MSASQSAAARTGRGPLRAAVSTLPMGQPMPDPLQVILERYGDELALCEGPGHGFTLAIAAEDVQGSLWTSTRRGITLLAQAYDGFRNAQEHAPKSCVCGRPSTAHLWDSRSKKNPCTDSGCADYQAAEVA